MNRTILFIIILICVLLFGAGAIWFIYTKSITGYVSPPVSEPSPSANDIKRDNISNIEKIINKVPFRKIKTTKQEYEALGWHKYENKEIGFEIYYPNDWKVSEGSKGRGDTSDNPSYMSITFAPKTLSYDFTFALYIFKESLKERIIKMADKEWLQMEKLGVNNADAVIFGRYGEDNKYTYKDVAFGADNWTIDFIGESNNSSVYERMFKSFRLLSEK